MYVHVHQPWGAGTVSRIIYYCGQLIRQELVIAAQIGYIIYVRKWSTTF